MSQKEMLFFFPQKKSVRNMSQKGPELYLFAVFLCFITTSFCGKRQLQVACCVGTTTAAMQNSRHSAGGCGSHQGGRLDFLSDLDLDLGCPGQEVIGSVGYKL